MSERVNQFCASLQNRLNSLEERAASLKASLQAVPREAADSLHERLEQAARKVESQKQAVAAARATVANWFEEQTTAVQAVVDEWKAKREVKKLAQRADRAEEHAAAAILVAQATIAEAEQAVLEAIAARLDADSASVG